MDITRRTAVRATGLAGLVAAGLVVPIRASVGAKAASELDDRDMPRPYRATFRQPPEMAPYQVVRRPNGDRVARFAVAERAAVARILPRLTTPVYGYDGLVPGPTISVTKGTRVRLRVRNDLPKRHQFGHEFDTSTHLHGSPSKPQFDGYASDLRRVGSFKDYEYENDIDARTIWYHDHAVHHTAENAYSGLSAHFHVHDERERALLPQGAFDVSLMVGDMMFAEDGRLAYDDNSTSGLFGDVILVNGVPWPTMKVQRRVYRFRMLNACISRSLRLRLSTRDPVTMVATDGGLMPFAQEVGSWRHSTAERYEFLVDFSRYAPGTRVQLRNLSNDNNVDYQHTNKVMAFDVTDEPVDTSDPTAYRIPTALNPGDATMALRTQDAVKRRTFELGRHNGHWVINDRTWEDVIRSGFTEVVADPGLGDVEIWEFENGSGGWFHPMHLHQVDYQVLSRNKRPPFAYERGPKDTVYVGENETVAVLARFGPHRGRYMIHCHNVPHEDHDMMVQFSVGLKPGEDDPNDPIEAAPSEPHDDRSDADIDAERYPDEVVES